MTGTIPAGAMIGFGGAPATPPTGWLFCDGAAHGLVAPYLNLASNISSNYGGDGVTVFNVPDLRGRFLRGTDHSTGRDPDASSRFAPAQNASTGDSPGSEQAYATGSPVAPFVVASAGSHNHTLNNVPSEDHHSAYGASGPAAKYTMDWTDNSVTTSSAGSHSHGVTGGDAETRPANLYLQWLIASDNLAGAPPIGSILPFGGDLTDLDVATAVTQAGWYPCMGGKLKVSAPANTALHAVIGSLYGGDSLTFNLPDLRGIFVAGAGRAYKIAQNISGATGLPHSPFVTTSVGDHTHTVGNVPDDTHEIDVVAGWDLAENNSGATGTSESGAHAHAWTGGGDSESRPLNLYADYIIRFI